MKEIRLTLPITEQQVRSLNVGDMVLISGVMFTGRDAVHKHLFEGKSIPVDIRGSAIYHCGPVVVKTESGEWSVRAAGPTTSTREEPYQATVIEKYGIRAVIGKGGMGAKTLKACKDFGCVYLHAVGGAAQVLAETVKKVRGVSMLEEFGSPEAIWELEVVDFPALVTIDAHGNSLHAEVASASEQKLNELLGPKK
ncbi:MAG: hydro-lyase, Fe-S type, tartrate/fumarate subfamily, alpha subunit [Pseudomonadota bacterium]|jgi:fumarate hydratase class I